MVPVPIVRREAVQPRAQDRPESVGSQNIPAAAPALALIAGGVTPATTTPKDDPRQIVRRDLAGLCGCDQGLLFLTGEWFEF